MEHHHFLIGNTSSDGGFPIAMLRLPECMLLAPKPLQADNAEFIDESLSFLSAHLELELYPYKYAISDVVI